MPRETLCARDVINTILARWGGRTYLEIGVRAGATFCHIDAPRKIAVDPIPAAGPIIEHLMNSFQVTYYQKTSDLFFEENGWIFNEQPIDVAFVDGLHSCAQVLRDIENCVRHLADGGVIVVHDCNPKSESAAAPGVTPETRKTLPGFNGNLAWNGDVWKAIVYLRACGADLDIFVLDCDQGLGIITRQTPANMLNISPENVAQMTYHDLAADRKHLLNLRSPCSFERFCAAGTSGRSSPPPVHVRTFDHAPPGQQPQPALAVSPRT